MDKSLNKLTIVLITEPVDKLNCFCWCFQVSKRNKFGMGLRKVLIAAHPCIIFLLFVRASSAWHCFI